MRFTWRTGLIVGLATVIGASLALQRQASDQLRGEIALVSEQNREITRLRIERKRLQAAQPSPAELENIRADHAAVERLRNEVEAMQARVTELENNAKP